MDRYTRHKKICENLNKIYISKNKDYGDSFNETIDEFGYVAALVRMSDKFNRLKSLICKQGEHLVKTESLADTSLDLANYAIMLAMRIIDDTLECKTERKLMDAGYPPVDEIPQEKL